MGADQFAVVAGEAMTAGGADLAVVIDLGISGLRIGGGIGGQCGGDCAGWDCVVRGGAWHTTL